MSATGDHRDRELPEEARAALRRRGDQLLERLDALREESAAPIKIDPLDPQAELSIRQQGDALLSSLDAERAALKHVPQTARSGRRRALAIAAAIIGVAGSLWLLNGAFPPAKPTVVKTIEESKLPEPQLRDHLRTSPPIPEPSSTLLTLAGMIVFLFQRRR